MMKKRFQSLAPLFILFELTSSCLAASPTKPNFGSSVATSSPEATRVAIDILKSGGNAIDAACAAVFALNVTQPHFTGIGGGGFALIHENGKRDVFLDFRESAPAKITSRLFYKAGTDRIISSWSKEIRDLRQSVYPALSLAAEKL